MITVDSRCKHPDCAEKNIYRMVGYCTNCETTEILMLFTVNHAKGGGDCPVCGCWRKVTPQRLATEDEMPDA
jgi:hypothetical protein